MKTNKSEQVRTALVRLVAEAREMPVNDVGDETTVGRVGHLFIPTLSFVSERTVAADLDKLSRLSVREVMEVFEKHDGPVILG